TGEVADHDPQEIGDRDVSPPTPVEVRDAEHDALDHDPDGKRVSQVPQIRGRQSQVEPQQKRQHARERKNRYLRHPHYRSVYSDELLNEFPCPAHHLLLCRSNLNPRLPPRTLPESLSSRSTRS